jgi:hypothetical protein
MLRFVRGANLGTARALRAINFASAALLSLRLLQIIPASSESTGSP